MSSGVPSVLQRGRHHIKELSNRAITTGMRRILTPEQAQAAAGFVKLFRERKNEYPPTHETMYQFTRYLDNYFFEGLLTRPGPYQLQLLVKPVNISNVYGYSDYPSVENHTPVICLNTLVRIKRGPNLSKFQQRMPTMLRTLAHEMAHNFLRQYSCSSEECRARSHGKDNHNEPWALLTDVIFKVIGSWQPEVLGYFFTLKTRISSIWLSYLYYAKSTPAAERQPDSRQVVYILNGKVGFRGDLAQRAAEIWGHRRGEDIDLNAVLTGGDSFPIDNDGETMDDDDIGQLSGPLMQAGAGDPSAVIFPDPETLDGFWGWWSRGCPYSATFPGLVNPYDCVALPGTVNPRDLVLLPVSSGSVAADSSSAP